MVDCCCLAHERLIIITFVYGLCQESQYILRLVLAWMLVALSSLVPVLAVVVLLSIFVNRSAIPRMTHGESMPLPVNARYRSRRLSCRIFLVVMQLAIAINTQDILALAAHHGWMVEELGVPEVRHGTIAWRIAVGCRTIRRAHFR